MKKIVYLLIVNLSLQSSGMAQNVGIGTTAPAYKLDVNGDINISTGNYLKINGVRVLRDNPNSGDNNVFLGDYADTASSSGFRNVAVGSYSMLKNTGAYNTAVGSTSLQNNTSGTSNTAVGEKAMQNNSTGGTNSAFGSGALQNNVSATGNVGVGYQALYSNSGANAFDNVGVGYQALYANSAGQFNTGCGGYSLNANTSGNGNTALGDESLWKNTTGSHNVAVGQGAMYQSITGSNNTAIGAGATTADGINNSTAIGYDAQAGSSNIIVLGNNSITDVISTGSFHQPSDARFKFKIQEDVPGLSFITKLIPVTYQLNVHLMNSKVTPGTRFVSDKISPGEVSAMRIRRTGFIAQDVEKAANETGFNFDAIHKPENNNDYYSLNYAGFVVRLVKAVQELSAENALLKKQLNDLSKKVQALKDKIGN